MCEKASTPLLGAPLIYTINTLQNDIQMCEKASTPLLGARLIYTINTLQNDIQMCEKASTPLLGAPLIYTINTLQNDIQMCEKASTPLLGARLICNCHILTVNSTSVLCLYERKVNWPPKEIMRLVAFAQNPALTIVRPLTPQPGYMATCEVQDEAAFCGISSWKTLFATTKPIFRERNIIVFGNYNK